MAKVIELTLANAPKVVVSRLAVVAPRTVIAATWLSLTTVEVAAAFATETPVMVKPVLNNFPFALLYSA